MIGQRSEISHTQVHYHFKKKPYLASLIIRNYLTKLLELVYEQTYKTGDNSTKVCKMYWWTLHYLILTSHRNFSRFFMEFMIDEQDAFVEGVGFFSEKVYKELFDLDVDINDHTFVTDSYIIASVDNVMARLCIEKSLKVAEAIRKLLNLDIMRGFRVEITEKEIETFIAENSLMNIVKEFDIESLVLDLSNY